MSEAALSLARRLIARTDERTRSAREEMEDALRELRRKRAFEADPTMGDDSEFYADKEASEAIDREVTQELWAGVLAVSRRNRGEG